MTLVNLLINISYGRNITIATSSGKYFLKTTFGHPLKRYLRNFDKYDRFLPYLSKALPKSVIDIGANIGDTLVLIKSVSNAEVICVEPDKNFIRYLKQNIELNQLKAVRLYPFPISSVKKTVIVQKNALKSTSNMSEVDISDLASSISTKTFHELLNDLSLDINSIGIIKSDTDGYDWDCLNSIADYFDTATDIQYPEFIFYEHQNYLNNLGKKDQDRKERERWYEDSLRRLTKHNYNEFYIFDNFGSLVRQTNSVNELLAITRELIETNSSGSLSNYFLDVLISRPSTSYIVKKALQLQAGKEMMIS